MTDEEIDGAFALIFSIIEGVMIDAEKDRRDISSLKNRGKEREEKIDFVSRAIDILKEAKDVNRKFKRKVKADGL